MDQDRDEDAEPRKLHWLALALSNSFQILSDSAPNHVEELESLLLLDLLRGVSHGVLGVGNVLKVEVSEALDGKWAFNGGFEEPQFGYGCH